MVPNPYGMTPYQYRAAPYQYRMTPYPNGMTLEPSVKTLRRLGHFTETDTLAPLQPSLVAHPRAKARPIQGIRKNIVGRCPVESQLHHDLADHAAELEAMTRKTSRDGNLPMGGMPVQDEMRVGSVREDARFHRHGRTVRIGKVLPDALPQDPLILGMAVPIHLVRVDALPPVEVLADLEAGH